MSVKQELAPDGFARVEDTRITDMVIMPPPAELKKDLPNESTGLVASTRAAIHAVLAGEDDRMLVVVGPCSVHDTKAALEYAGLLHEQAKKLEEDLLVVMRVYFEKPRTTIGWKGLINDPDLNGKHDTGKGLRVARDLLRSINALGVPCGTEFLDTMVPQYISDLVSWGAIGARTTESQIHRQLASGLSCPVGFKNGTDGNVAVVAAAIAAARAPHHFLAVTNDGVCALASTSGNEDTHAILRGGTTGPNYDAESVAYAASLIAEAGFRENIMIDCSHANSGKDYRKQPEVAAAVMEQVAGGDRRICGLMIESNLVAGNQSVNAPELTYGQSVTDGCISWQDTAPLLEELAAAVRARRESI